MAESHQSEGTPPGLFFASYLLPHLLLATTLAVSPRLQVRLAFWLLFVCLSLPGLRSFPSSEDKSGEYALGVAFGNGMVYALHLLIVDPIRVWRHYTDKDDPRELPIIKRVFWTWSTINSPRGLGWNYKVPNITVMPKLGRWRFVGWSLIRAFGFFIALDIVQTYVYLHPRLPHQSLNQLPLLQQCLLTCSWVFSGIFSTSMMYYLFAAGVVSLGLSSWHLWPPVYGRFREAYSVRRLWSHSWHLLMRRQVSGIGKMVSQSLGLPAGSWSSKYMQLFIGFLASGIGHAAADYKLSPDRFPTPLAFLTTGAIPFFLAQAAAILFEDIIIELASIVLGSKLALLRRFVGHLWVVAWFVISWRWYSEFAFEAGLIHGGALSISPVRYLASVSFS